MAYQARLMTFDVEALGATWHWQTPDRTLVLMQQAMRRLKITSFNTDDLPDEVAELLPQMFLEGVTGWEGVEDEAGEPRDCTAQTRGGIPTGDKLIVTTAYLTAVNELQAGNARSAGGPTASTPPANGSPADTTTSPTSAPPGD